jgi:hypothetical protein
LAGAPWLVLMLRRGSRHRGPLLAFACAWLLLCFASALTGGTENTRYAVEAIPLLWVVGSAGLACFVRALWAMVRGARSPGSRTVEVSHE